MTASAATLSACGLYRYTLDRDWAVGPRAIWIMHNPSTADANVDDPTIRRVRSFTEREGCGGFTVVNLYAWRATNPRELRAVADPVGPDNDRHIAAAVRAASGPVIAAWGAIQSWQRIRVARLLQGPLARAELRCIGEPTKANHPRHPLYLPGNAPLQHWPWAP